MMRATGDRYQDIESAIDQSVAQTEIVVLDLTGEALAEQYDSYRAALRAECEDMAEDLGDTEGRLDEYWGVTVDGHGPSDRGARVTPWRVHLVGDAKADDAWDDADLCVKPLVSLREQAAQLAQGDYQERVVRGTAALSGSDLKGTARDYGARYKASRARVLAAVSNAGIPVAVIRRSRGRLELLFADEIGFDAFSNLLFHASVDGSGEVYLGLPCVRLLPIQEDALDAELARWEANQ
jgi:hypothetical protein